MQPDTYSMYMACMYTYTRRIDAYTHASTDHSVPCQLHYYLRLLCTCWLSYWRTMHRLCARPMDYDDSKQLKERL